MSTNPQLVASNYIVNIVELQNVITSASGLTPLSILNNQVQNIAQMVNFEQKRINANTIAAFNTTPIQVINDLNMSNSVITSNGANASGSASVSVLGPVSVTSGGISVSAGSTVMTLLSNSSDAVIFSAGGLNLLTLASNGDATLPGTVSAFQFITLSDARYKKNISDIENAMDLLKGLKGVRFDWVESGLGDIGFLAQDVETVLPEAIYGEERLSVAYHKILPVLVEAVKKLEARVCVLEGRQPAVPVVAGIEEELYCRT
jgi:hypothetical protein